MSRPTLASVYSVGLCLVAGMLLPGCGSRSPKTAPPVSGPASTTSTTASQGPSAADLRAAEKAVTVYFTAVIAGKYGDAAALTEAATMPDAKRQAFAATLKAAYGAIEPKGITSVGPARRGSAPPGTIVVPYSVSAKQPLIGEAIVRKVDRTHGWLISGGI